MRMTSGEELNAKSIVVESSFGILEDVVDQAFEFFSMATDDVDVLHRVMLLTSEAVTNGIKHGNKMDRSKSVSVEFLSSENTLEVWVEDEGPGFVRADIPNPLDSEHLLDIGGRGIFLIEKMADEVHYELGGRRVGMTFILTDKDQG